jgi:HEPN domain-containing protein
MDEAQRADAELWLRKARDDRAVARLVADRGGPGAVGCFLCQQAAEKLLKAYMVAAGLEPPRTHDLDRLVRLLLAAGHRVDADIDRLSALTQYAVAPRYPGFPDEHADQDLVGFVAFVDQLYELVVRAIGSLDHAP